VKALFLSCTLKSSPEASNTESLPRVVAADIVVLAGPTWLGQSSSVAKQALERMDAMISESDEQQRPHNMRAVARALAANPIPAPPG
jgi:multimeric flavodoxin WrbA